jgi:Ca2+-binding EF-hand superfamily protein
VKFAILALLGLVSVNAVKIHQKSTLSHKGGPPTAAKIFEECNSSDVNSLDHLTLAEIHTCIDTNMEEADRAGAHAMVDESFADVAGLDGEKGVSEADLAAAMRAHGGPPALVQKGGRGKKSDSDGSDSDEGPTAAELFALCNSDDVDSLDHLTLDEITTCIDTNMEEADRAEAHAKVDKHFARISNGDDGVTEAELAAEMKDHPRGPPALVQLRDNDLDEMRPPTVEEVFKEMDGNKNGVVTREEARQAVNKQMGELAKFINLQIDGHWAQLSGEEENGTVTLEEAKKFVRDMEEGPVRAEE